MRQASLPRRGARATRLLQVVLCIALLGYCGVVAIQAARQNETRFALLVAAPLLAAAAVVAAVHFRRAVLLLPISALAVPIDLSTGTETRLPISLLLTVLLTLIWVCSQALRGWRLAASPLNAPLLVLGLIVLVSFVWGLVWRDPGLNDWTGHFLFVQLAALMTILASLAAPLLIGNFVRTAGQLRYLAAVFLGCFCLMLLLRVFNITQSILVIRGLWSLWLITLLYALLIAQPGLAWRWRGLLLITLVLTFFQVLFRDSLWVSGWLPGIVAILAVTFIRSRRAFVALAIAVVLVSLTPPVQGFFEQIGQQNVDEGAMERLSIWEQNWRVVRDHWLFGTGPAGYAIYYMTYYRDTARSTHNNYLDILAQFGFSGMAAWLWLCAAGLWEGWRLARQAPPGLLRTLAITVTGGWVGALASMFLGDWVLPFAYNQTITGYKYTIYSWIFLGALISIRQLLAERPAGGESGAARP